MLYNNITNYDFFNRIIFKNLNNNSKINYMCMNKKLVNLYRTNIIESLTLKKSNYLYSNDDVMNNSIKGINVKLLKNLKRLCVKEITSTLVNQLVHLKNLESLTVKKGWTNSYTLMISNLKKLKTLNLSYEHDDNVEEFERDYYYENDNYYIDMMFFNKFKNLENLYLNYHHKEQWNVRIKNFHMFHNVNKLKNLYLSYIRLDTKFDSCIDMLSSVTNLHILDIEEFEELFETTTFSNIKTLNIDTHNINVNSYISNIINLKSLKISNTNNIFLQLLNFVNLEKLELYLVNNDNLLHLSRFINLKHLSIRNNIEDLLNLSTLVNLKHLELQNNRIEDISPLSNLTNLKYLNLQNNIITDVLPLSNLVNLEHLKLSNNRIDDISCLTTLVNLKYLDLYGTRLNNLLPLLSFVNLNYLDIRANNITDMSILDNFSNLKIYV